MVFFEIYRFSESAGKFSNPLVMSYIFTPFRKMLLLLVTTMSSQRTISTEQRCVLTIAVATLLTEIYQLLMGIAISE